MIFWNVILTILVLLVIALFTYLYIWGTYLTLVLRGQNKETPSGTKNSLLIRCLCWYSIGVSSLIIVGVMLGLAAASFLFLYMQLNSMLGA